MYTFLLLVVLAVGLSVALQVLTDLVPVRLPAALTRAVAVAAGAGLAWVLGYSVFAAFGQELRADWMHPMFTGLALVATGELVRSVLAAVAGRGGELPASTVAGDRTVRAA
jgi:hypothetical protein